MTLKTVPVRVVALCPDNSPAARATITAQLVDALGRKAVPSFDGDVVVPVLLSVDADDNGSALLHLWPNARGTVPTAYRVVGKMGAQQVMDITIAVPDSDPAIEIPIGQLRDQAAWPALDPAQEAQREAQASAQAAHADALKTAADRIQTAADRIQVGQDRAVADASASQANNSMLTAVAQAAAASLFALAASSVAQQDFSGYTSSPVHRSGTWTPVTTHIYDTSKDSDGGAWTSRCEHLGWYNEPIQGAWLPHCCFTGTSSETVARAAGGTLGANLVPNGNSVAGFSFSNGAGSTDSNGHIRITNPVGGAYGSMTPVAAIPTVVGQVYLITFDAYGSVATGGGQVFSAGNGISGAARSNYVATNTPVAPFVFVATSTTLYLDLYTSGSLAGGYTTWGNVQVRQVQAFAGTGFFYPNSTDGRFYKTWKNRFASSADFTQGAWGRTAITNVVRLSDGVGDKVIPDATNNSHRLGQSPGLLAGVQQSVTLRAKAAERNWLILELGAQFAYFNLTTGTLGATITAGVTATITAVPSAQMGGVAGYYDCTITCPNPVNAVAYCYIASADGVAAYSGDGVGGMLFAQAQCELGAPSAYEAKGVTDGIGVLEVDRGNKRAAPKLPLLVLERGSGSGRLVVYDLLEPGRPMWMVFKGDATERAGGLALFLANSAVAQCITARNGKVWIGMSRADGAAPFYGGFVEIDFTIGKAYQDRVANTTCYEAPIEKRNQAAMVLGGRKTITTYGAFADITSLSAYVYPDAPYGVDGLQVPTVALTAWTGGARVRRHDGSVVNLMTSAGNMDNVRFGPRGDLMMTGGGGLAYKTWLFNSVPTASTNTPDFTFGGVTVPARPLNDGSTGRVIPIRNMGRVKALAFSAAAQLCLLAYNPMTPSMSAVAYIGQYNSTGWMVGDVRRSYISEALVGSVSGSNLATNGDFSAGTTGWSLSAGFAAATASVVAGELQVVEPNGNFGRWMQVISGFTIGKAYTITAQARIVSGSVARPAFVGFSTDTTAGVSAGTVVSTTSGVLTSGSTTFIAAQTSYAIVLGTNTAGSVAGETYGFDNVVVSEAVADATSKGAYYAGSGFYLKAFGNLTRSSVGVGAQLSGISGFSAGNFLQEPAPSTDHDYGVGSWAHRLFVSMPGIASGTGNIYSANSGCYFPLANFAVLQNIPVNFTTEWNKGTGWTTPTASTFALDGTQTGLSDLAWASGGRTPTTNRTRKWTLTVTAITPNGGALQVFSNSPAPINITTAGTYTFLGEPNITTCTIRGTVAGMTCSGSLQVDELEDAPIFHRGYSAGASFDLSVSATGYLIGTANDGVGGKRQVVSPAQGAYNMPSSAWTNPQLSYDANGTLTLRVNGNIVQQTFGTPLASLSNASALLTLGTNYAQTSFFPGSIALLRMGASVPTDDLALWMYQQESQMFRDGAQVTLMDGNGATDLDYDVSQDKLKHVTAANEASFIGLVRVAGNAVTAGTYAGVSHAQGVKAVQRATAFPGVEVTLPPQNAKEDLLRKGAEEAARNQRGLEMYDWVGGFTGNLSAGTNTILSVSGLSLPVGATAKGAQVSHANLPAGTFIVDIVGTTIYLSANATGTLVGATIAFLDFILPAGMEWREGFAARQLQQEGATKDYTRLFDGFRERARFGAAPGATSFVRGNARRMV
jgi:hypothetical protein